MKRKCEKIDKELFIQHLGVSSRSFKDNIEIYVDLSFRDEFFDIINRDKYFKKFLRIVFVVYSGLYNEDLYGTEKVSKKAKHVTAMKFKRGAFNNLRIYCKEVIHNGKKVVMIQAYPKKAQGVDKKNKNILETIGGYEYEF